MFLPSLISFFFLVHLLRLTRLKWNKFLIWKKKIRNILTVFFCPCLSLHLFFFQTQLFLYYKSLCFLCKLRRRYIYFFSICCWSYCASESTEKQLMKGQKKRIKNRCSHYVTFSSSLFGKMVHFIYLLTSGALGGEKTVQVSSRLMQIHSIIFLFGGLFSFIFIYFLYSYYYIWRKKKTLKGKIVGGKYTEKLKYGGVWRNV